MNDANGLVSGLSGVVIVVVVSGCSGCCCCLEYYTENVPETVSKLEMLHVFFVETERAASRHIIIMYPCSYILLVSI